MNIGMKLRNRRKELNLTLLDIAKMVGVSEATVSRWESGEIVNMKRDKILLLSKALQITPNFIMDLDEERPKTAKNTVKEHINIIKIAGRDGSYEERALTDEQLELFKKMIDALPEATDL